MAAYPAQNRVISQGDSPLPLLAVGALGIGAYLYFRNKGTGAGSCGIPAGSLVVDAAKPQGQFTPFYYITADCHKRWIESVADGQACGWNLLKTIPVDGSLIAAIPAGPDITGPPDCPQLGAGFI